ncbi:hypothetical protein FRB99_008713 [Tulasnella sp. 403]|nr:hypothetical protein FRB99_008713 [Tulasnella sp. 403]
MEVLSPVLVPVPSSSRRLPLSSLAISPSSSERVAAATSASSQVRFPNPVSHGATPGDSQRTLHRNLPKTDNDRAQTRPVCETSNPDQLPNKSVTNISRRRQMDMAQSQAKPPPVSFPSSAHFDPSKSRSRTPSCRKRNTRPGTAAVAEASRPSSPSPPVALRRAVSLDESALSSCRSRRLSPTTETPFYPGYSSTSPLADPPRDNALVVPSLVTQDVTDGASVHNVGANANQEQMVIMDNRRMAWHILAEILATERGYLSHLRVLVQVYLDHLPRYFTVSPEDMAAVCRNTQDILQLHESLALEFIQVENTLQALYAELSRADVVEKSERALGQAIDRVARILVSASNQFEVYQAYCSGQPDALTVVRRLQARSAEWNAFEQRCATLSAGGVVFLPRLKRRHSTESIGALGTDKDDPKHHASHADRLHLMDVLIKPIQRICKYPFILRELLQATTGAALTTTPESDPICLLALALEAMREAAAKVNDAKEARESATKSRVIIARMEMHPVLTSSFISLLGNISLVGALEVVYHHTVHAPLRPPAKARYCGAFLYPGYIILVKVKKGRLYEPRHWFPLKNVELFDVPDDKALLPCSFRLSSGLHHFELSACCEPEKGVWMAAIAQARLHTRPLGERLDAVTSLQSVYNEARIMNGSEEVGLATILADAERDAVLLNDGQGSRDHRRNMGESAVMAAVLPTLTPSRRNSIFSIDYTAPNLVRRPSTSHRHFVERTLGDIFSEPCLKARTQAAQVQEWFAQAYDPTLNGRTASWGRASTVISRTSSVGSMFLRRPVNDGRAIGLTRSVGSHDEETGEPRRSPSSMCPNPRTSAVFPSFTPPFAGSHRRRIPPTVATLALSTCNFRELDEQSGEGVTTPDSAPFPLTPEASAFQEYVAAPASPDGTNESHADHLPIPFQKAPLNVGSTSKHRRTKSQVLAQGVRELLFRRRGSLSGIDQAAKNGGGSSNGHGSPPSGTNDRSHIPPGLPRDNPSRLSILGMVRSSSPTTPSPTTNDEHMRGKSPLSIFQRGMALMSMSRKRASSASDTITSTAPPAEPARPSHALSAPPQPARGLLALPPDYIVTDFDPGDTSLKRQRSSLTPVPAVEHPAVLRKRPRVQSAPWYPPPNFPVAR